MLLLYPGELYRLLGASGLYLPTIYTPVLTDNPPILLTMDTYVAAKGKVCHVTSSAFRSFSGFIIALQNIYEKFIFCHLVI